MTRIRATLVTTVEDVLWGFPEFLLFGVLALILIVTALV